MEIIIIIIIGRNMKRSQRNPGLNLLIHKIEENLSIFKDLFSWLFLVYKLYNTSDYMKL